MLTSSVGPQSPATALKNGPTLPATCTPGQVFIVPSGGSAGAYVCFTADTWTLLDSTASGEVTRSRNCPVTTAEWYQESFAWLVHLTEAFVATVLIALTARRGTRKITVCLAVRYATAPSLPTPPSPFRTGF